MDEQHREGDEQPIEPRTGPVRIIGAHRAGGPVEELSEHEETPGTGDEPEGFGPEDWATPAEPALPHWTEAPTGEVPAVLSRAGSDEDDPWSAVPEPSWREEHADWDRADPLDAALWPGAGEGRPLDETDAADREPWSFELGGPSRGDELDEEDLFSTWDEGAAAAGSRWGDEAGGARWGDEAGSLPPPPASRVRVEGSDAVPPWAEPDDDLPDDDLAAGGPGPGPGWPPENAWDPDTVAGEKTTVMRLPGHAGSAGAPATESETDEQLPPPATASAGGRARAREGVPGAFDVPEVAELDEAALEDEALAADLEARRGRHRGGERAGAPGPVLTASPPGPQGRGASGVRPREKTPVGAGVPGRPGAARRGDDAVSQRTGRNIPAAIASGVVVGGLALVAFHFGTVPSMVVVTAVIGLAAVEAFGAFRRAGYHPATLLGLVAVIGLIVGSYIKAEQALPLVTVLLVAATFVWHLAGVDRRAEPVRSTAATLLVYAWVGVFGSFAALLLAPSLFPDRHGIAYLLGALIAAVAYDVGALAVGAWVGRHPLSHVSPGKTWEGVVGGAVAALVLSVGVVHLIHPWTLVHSVILGVVVAVVSPIGDLCESLVKRRLGLKDMGRILPGHGGLLDRVDGLLFVLPATFYLVRAFHG